MAHTGGNWSIKTDYSNAKKQLDVWADGLMVAEFREGPNALDNAKLFVAAPKLLAAVNVVVKASKEPSRVVRHAKMVAAQDLAIEALKLAPETPAAPVAAPADPAVDTHAVAVPDEQEMDPLKEIERLVALVDRMQANERRLINELFNATQRQTATPSATNTSDADTTSLTYADGMREAARLVELWMQYSQVAQAFEATENRDATRLLFFIPDRLRDCANDSALPGETPAGEESVVPAPITRTERALFQMMLRTTEVQPCPAPRVLPQTELDAASRSFEASDHYSRAEFPVDRAANWQVWIDAWRTRAAQANDGARIERQVHMDEIDAARVGEKFIHDKIAELGDEAKELVYADRDMQAALPRVKWTALFDCNDRLRAAYLLNRDLMNWCQVTLISVI
jgi:hypothetical protein